MREWRPVLGTSQLELLRCSSRRRSFISEIDCLTHLSPTNRYGLSVREKHTWLVTAGLMLAAAAATGRSTYLYWLPCRGSMLRGSFINYYVNVGRQILPWV